MSVTISDLQFANSVIGAEQDILHDIHLSEKNIAIYKRKTKDWNERVKPLIEQSIELKANGTIKDITSQFQQFFNDLPQDYDFLYNDIVSLLDQFSHISKSETFRALLATVSSNMCRKFHTDVNDLRMLCTYSGPGTMWLPDEAVDWNATATRRSKFDIVFDESLIQQVDTGDVTILKGALYPNSDGILHRSPTIEETGEKRLLLRIDTNETLNLWK